MANRRKAALILGAVLVGLAALIGTKKCGGVGFADRIEGRNSERASGKFRADAQDVLEPRDPRFSDSIQPLGRPVLDRFIEEHSNTPESVVVAFLASWDGAYLERLKKFPKSPLAAAILASSDNRVAPAERLLWAERLHALEPENGLGQVLISNALFDNGDGDAAILALDKALQAPKLQSTMSQLKPIAADLASRMSKDQRFDFFQKLQNSSILNSIYPAEPDGPFNGRSKEEGMALARKYMEVLPEFSPENGFDVIAAPKYFDDNEAIRTSNYQYLLSMITRSYGEKAALELDPRPLGSMVEKTVSDITAWRKQRHEMTPSEVDAMVDEALFK